MSRPATRSYIISIVCSSSSCAASVGSLNKRNLGSVLRGIAALGASEGHRGTPGPTRNRALAHQGDIDLFAGGRPIIAKPQERFIHQGRPKAGTKLAMTFHILKARITCPAILARASR